MKSTAILALLLVSFSGISATNFGDDLDKNNVPGTLEDRKYEEGNSIDVVDKNKVPAVLEERQKEEQIESDAVQTDDPEKLYDPIDREIDE